MAKRKNHPYADLFPMMTPLELEALAADIAENGLCQPVVLYKGDVLDGRNRLKACEQAGVEPTFSEYEGDDPLGMVLSLNIHRRDMTSAQRAIVAARALPPFEEERSKKRGGDPRRHQEKSSPNGKSSDDVGKVFKVSGKSVQQAKAILEESPDLASQVESCSISLAAAYESLQERRATSKRKAKDTERIAEFTEAVSEGKMTLEQALQEAIERERKQREDMAAEADARRTWLKDFVEHYSWFEVFVFQRTDEDLAWYTRPDSPGLFEHGMTAEKVAQLESHLKRVRTITFRRKT